MDAPSPRAVEARAVDIGALSKTVSFDYGWLFDSAFRTGSARVDVGSIQHHSVHSDLSSLMSGDISYIRRKVGDAAERVEKAYHELRKAKADLKEAFVRIDEHHPGERERFEKVIERPDTGEQKRLEAAQRRREERAKSNPLGMGEAR